MAIPKENIAVFLQKFTVTAPTATAFSALYNSVGVFTTNVPNSRQWQFTFNGNFTSLERFEIIYDFSQVDTFGYSIKFEGDLNGFITCDKQIYACDRYLKYIPQTEEDIKNKIVRLLFKPPCPGQELVNRSLYYVVNLNDTSCASGCYSDFETAIGYELIDVKTINSGKCTSQYENNGFTVCGHKNVSQGATVVFLYYTTSTGSPLFGSNFAFQNLENGWVVQLTYVTIVPPTGITKIAVQDGSSTEKYYPCSQIYTNLTSSNKTATFTWNGSCWGSNTNVYTDPYPVTLSTNCGNTC